MAAELKKSTGVEANVIDCNALGISLSEIEDILTREQAVEWLLGYLK